MINTFVVEQQFRQDEKNTEPFDEFLDRVVEEAEKIGLELDYTANRKELTATWLATLDIKDSELSPMEELLSSLRTALHAAFCNTAQWAGRPVTEKVERLKDEDLTAA